MYTYTLYIYLCPLYYIIACMVYETVACKGAPNIEMYQFDHLLSKLCRSSEFKIIQIANFTPCL